MRRNWLSLAIRVPIYEVNMTLTECKICNHHICVMKDVVLCGYKIDRMELPLKEENAEKVVAGCPKEVIA